MIEATGKQVQVIIDTGCSQSVVRANLMPHEGAVKTTPIRMICMHVQASMYEHRKIPVTAYRITREISIGVAPKLPYTMVLGRDWSEMHAPLDAIRAQEKCQAVLLREEVAVPGDGGMRLPSIWRGWPVVPNLGRHRDRNPPSKLSGKPR